MSRVIETRRRCSSMHVAQMILLLSERGYTDVELAKAVGLGAGAVAHWRRQMRRGVNAVPNIYIEGWANDSRGRPFTPVYRCGDGVDVERNGQSISPAERMRALRASRKGGVS